MSTRSLMSWLEPPDAVGRDLARAGEVRAAQMRIWVAAMGETTMLVARSPTPYYLYGYAVMLVAGIGGVMLARRPDPPRWLTTVSCLFDITLLNLINAALLADNQPLMVMSSRAFFTVTILFLSLTCLRQDPRLCALTGAMAILQYGALVAWTATHWNLGVPLPDAAMYGTFSWGNQVSRLALLATATAVNIVIVNTSRAYGRESIHDSLTGLVNRRYAERRLDEALAAARRTRRPLVLALADVDHFKEVNDTYGHAAGDAVLRGIASALRGTFRSSDVIARFGGDEFLILMPESEPAHAIDRLTRFQTTLAVPSPTTVNISIGVALWPMDGSEPGELLAHADHRLYVAKENGRNRVEAPLIGALPEVGGG
jgi:diguanylate cyclase (GGDEF)-like protein